MDVYKVSSRRDVYKTVNRTDLFPLPFCKTLWVEDKNVAAKGIAIWPYMLEFIKYNQSLSQSKRQKKMDFCHDISNLFSELLTKFQTHIPVMPFPF